MVGWPYCFWVCGKAVYCGGACVGEQSCLPYGGWETKWKKGWKRLRSHSPLQGRAPADCRPPCNPQLLTFLPSLHHAALGSKPSAHGPWGHFRWKL